MTLSREILEVLYAPGTTPASCTFELADQPGRNFWPYGIILTFVIFVSGLVYVACAGATTTGDILSGAATWPPSELAQCQ